MNRYFFLAIWTERELKLAKAAHEMNKMFCELGGDFTQPPWETAPPNIQQSAIDGVRFVLANPEAPDAASHENWLKFKRADGWKYGPVKDPVKKEHPCMVPFAELPLHHRAKNTIFRAVVLGLSEF